MNREREQQGARADEPRDDGPKGRGRKGEEERAAQARAGHTRWRQSGDQASVRSNPIAKSPHSPWVARRNAHRFRDVGRQGPDTQRQHCGESDEGTASRDPVGDSRSDSHDQHQ